MSKVKFELNRVGVRELMQSNEMQAVLISHARQIKNRAGDNYSVHVGKTRANVSVRTANKDGIQDNLDNNTLLKAVR